MTRQEQIWFDRLQQEKMADFKCFNKPEYRNLFDGVVNMYSVKTHFIYELLQNADDALATKAKLELKKDGVYFMHNGKMPFAVSDPDEKQSEKDRSLGKLGSVNSITAIGYSTKNRKAEDTSIKIGKFGVGFKAVFQYTDTPIIYNTNISFRIENFIIPYLLEDNVCLDGEYSTCFYLPFNSKNQSKEQAYKEIKKALVGMKNPVLFLPHLNKLECSYEDEVFSFEKLEVKEKGFKRDGIAAKYIKTIQTKQKDSHAYFWFFNRKIKIEGSLFPITVGYELNQNQTIKTQIRPNLYCFFPVGDKIDLCLYLNAPFELVSNRQNILYGDTNEKIIKELASLAADSLLLLRDIGKNEKTPLLNDNIFKIVPTAYDEYDEDELLSHFYKSFLNVLQNEKVFITDGNEYVAACEGINASDEIVGLMNQRELNEFIECSPKEYEGIKYYYIYTKKDPKISDVDEYIRKLGIRKLYPNEFAQEITIEFLQRRNLDWLKRFYELLCGEACNKLLRKTKIHYLVYSTPYFRYKPIIRLNNGSFAAPYNEDDSCNVFLPPTHGSLDLNVVDESLLSDKNFKELLNRLEIKQPDELDYIRNVIFTKCSDDEHSISDEEMVNYLNVIYGHFISINDIDADKKSQFVEECSKHKILLGHCQKHMYRCTPDGLYIYSKFFSKYLPKDTFYVRDRVYRDVFGDKWDKFTDFLKVLGVNSYIRILKKVKNEYDLIYNLLPNVKYNQYISFTDYELDGDFVGFIKRSNYSLHDSVELYKSIIHQMDIKAEFKYVYYRQYTETIDPKFIRDCKDPKNKWLFDKNNELKAVDELTTETINDIYEKNDDFFKLIGIKFESEPSEEELINRLSPETRRLIEKGKESEEFNLSLEEKDLIKKRRAREERKKKNNCIQSICIRDRQDSIDDSKPFEVVYRPDIEKSFRFEKSVDVPNVSTESIESLLLTEIESYEKYSCNWFVKMLEYESMLHGEGSGNQGGFKIRFSDYTLFGNGEHTICLSNPNRNIPPSIESMDDIIVEFKFNNEVIDIHFEAACVKEYSLLLKFRKIDQPYIYKLESIKDDFLAATLSVEKPIPLIDELKSAFLDLNITFTDSLKNHLPNNLKFIFGPPGTGKTTKIVNEYIHPLSVSPKPQKVLFLCPTNKACDVILKRAVSILNERSKPWEWLHRFVQTMDDSLDDYVVKSNFDVPVNKKFCLISTIARFPYDGFNHNRLNEIKWDRIVIDEASMVPLPYVLYAVMKYPQTEFIIAGDPFQIEPIVMAPQWKGENIYSFVGLDDFRKDSTSLNNYPVNKLSKQYRSVRAIGQLFSKYRYNGLIEHHRTEQRILKIDGLNFKTNNFIYFHSSSEEESIFIPQKIQSSNIQVYSILLVHEFLKFLVKNIVENNEGKWRVGVICPYKAEADVIKKLWSQQPEPDSDKIEVEIGTIHGFQGDECDVIIAVYNPPKGGLVKNAQDTFINNKNIMNVAVSRAKDYFFMFYPDKLSPNFNKMYEINEIGRLALLDRKSYCGISAEYLEEVLFDDKHYIEKNSFVTYHQMSNVYSKPVKKYEVRVDETAVDIILTEDMDI